MTPDEKQALAEGLAPETIANIIDGLPCSYGIIGQSLTFHGDLILGGSFDFVINETDYNYILQHF